MMFNKYLGKFIGCRREEIADKITHYAHVETLASIDEWDIGLINALRRANLYFTSDIKSLTDEDLLSIKNIGITRLKLIRQHAPFCEISHRIQNEHWKRLYETP